jgi:chromosome segregation ATPase
MGVPPSPPLIEELRSALASAERRVEELDARARIADAERTVAITRANAESAQLREQLGLHLESLNTARGRLTVRDADQPALEDELFARADRIAALERELDAQRRAFERQSATLTAERQRSESLECDLGNARAGLARRDSQIAILEADLRARQNHESLLAARLTDALGSIEPEIPHLRAELSEQRERVGMLTAQLAEATARNAERDQDLEVAEESIRNLEIELRDKAGKLSEANVAVEEWRAVIAESQRSIQQRDSRIQQLQSDLESRSSPVVDSLSHTSEEVALEGPARVLIRTDGNMEYVHVLGRRTRIGRGSDNELVLDTKHVSRYHAALLAGPTHTTIEDLNSTNGVFVNGKRVSRQALKDGDKVTIGRSQFRYTVRG